MLPLLDRGGIKECQLAAVDLLEFTVQAFDEFSDATIKIVETGVGDEEIEGHWRLCPFVLRVTLDHLRLGFQGNLGKHFVLFVPLVANLCCIIPRMTKILSL